eukprot:TRINITY_DN10181_c0_g1_i1.p1 TRINITY_DN10181_c0_g1~~TRINITY_DN10181_c0_g1_i1.p1  ORF type:complete len:394 (-),score=83.45 TRINITY_DN10181_c0_g1_i1:332-1513(-)
MSMEEPLVQPAPAEHNDHDDQAGHGHAHGAVKHSDDDANGPEAEPAKNPNEARNKLIKATALCFCFMVAELVGGLLAHSLAIMTDAAHLLSDLAGFAISIIAIQLAKKEANLSYSFGYHRAEILGALASVMLIWALTAVLVFEAIDRLQDPRKIHVDGLLMFIISILGIAVNGAMMLVLGGHGHSHAGGGDHGHSHGASGQTGHAHGAGSDEEHGHSHGGHDGDKEEEEDGEGAKNINVEAAWVHVLGDLVQGVGVMIAAILIWWAPGMTTCSKYDLDCGHWMKNQETSPTGIPIGGLSGKFWVGQDEGTFKSGINWYVADPACTLLFSVLVMYTTTGIVRSSISVLMAKAPITLTYHLNTHTHTRTYAGQVFHHSRLTRSFRLEHHPSPSGP